MKKKLPPNHTVTDLSVAKPRIQTRNQHPNCDDCQPKARPADITLTTTSSLGGGGTIDLCYEHFKSGLVTDQRLATEILAGLVHEVIRLKGENLPAWKEHEEAV